MNPPTNSSPRHQALPHQQHHQSFSQLLDGKCTNGGCLKHCVDGSTSNPILCKRKNADALDLDEGLIAKALTQMSIGERSRVYESIHGVEEIKDEDDPAHILSLQYQMKQEIYRLVAEAGGSPQLNGLNFALQLNEEYVVQPNQLLRFLRCDSYDPIKAARRLAKWFDWKLELWGVDKLTREIVLDDLSKEELEVYKLGYGQRLPTRDQAGREVWVYHQMNQKNPDDFNSHARLVFYQGTVVQESQKSGIVCIVLYLERFRWDRFNPKEMKIHARSAAALPIKVASIHQCYIGNDSAGSANVIKYFLTLVDEETRARVKIHQGSYTEICYVLMTFGIPHTTIPLTHDGKLKTKFHLDFLQMRKRLENYRAKGTSVAMIELPLNSDILLGKGVPVQSHPGNVCLQAIVDDYVDQYHAITNHKDKTKLAADIVLMVKQESCRFLSKESGVWMEVDDSVAREKVSQAFRYRRKHAKKVDTSLASASSTATAHSSKAESKRLKSRGA